MASAAEQLAANINWSAFAKADELRSASGSRSARWSSTVSGPTSRFPESTLRRSRLHFSDRSRASWTCSNMFSGGAVQRMAVFALNIMPYISASIIIQLLSSVVPSLEAIKKEGEQGRKVLNQYNALSDGHSRGLPGLWHFRRA